MRQRRMEIRRLVAFETSYSRVFPAQRKNRLVMRERTAGGHFLPARRGVAAIAPLADRAAVWILMARCAVSEGKACILDILSSLAGSRMTLCAGDAGMRATQAVFRGIMLKTAGRLPGVLCVAPRAISPELSPVRILVAGAARRGKAQQCVIKVFPLQQSALRGQDEFRLVALLTAQPAMFALE